MNLALPRTIFSGSVRHAQLPLKPIPQRFNPLVLGLSRWALPLLLRLRLRRWLPSGIARIEARNTDLLVDLFRDFDAGNIRLVIAFHHPEVDDPLCMLHLLSSIVPRAARRRGIRLRSPIHSFFLFDRGMTLWGGRWLGWLLSRLGGVSIRRGRRPDYTAIRAMRQLLAEGRFPIAVAPQGATNGHSEIVNPLEPGVAQLGFWCVEDLLAAGRSETVLIVPVGIRYFYLTPPWQNIGRLLHRLEAQCGIATGGQNQSGPGPKSYYDRLIRLGEFLIGEMESFYRHFYHLELPQPQPSTGESTTDRNQNLAIRLKNLLDAALRVDEETFALPGRGSIDERCRRIEEAGWSRIYREDLPDLDGVSALGRGLADWIAEEADVRMRHMRLAESLTAVTGTYVRDHPTAERFAETLLILHDVVSRLVERKLPRRPRLGWRRVVLTIGKPISVSDRWLPDRRDRHAARQAVMDLTQDLHAALERLQSSD
jgi:1-acyl-sn-glycerol-3-phosphate acyltransferase